MKNIYITFFLVLMISSNYVMCITTLSTPDGHCWVIGKVKLYGSPWINACCENVQLLVTTCEDNCNSSSPPPPSPPNFENSPAHFTLNDGRNIWIVEDDELSSDTFDEESSIYEEVNSIPDFSWLDNSDSIEYATINIDLNTYAIVERQIIGVQLRKKNNSNSPSTEFSSNDLINNLKEKYKLSLYPNPIKFGEEVNFNAPTEVETVSITSLSNGQNTKIIFKKVSENTYSFNSSPFKGTYLIEVTLNEGIIMRDKLIIK